MNLHGMKKITQKNTLKTCPSDTRIADFNYFGQEKKKTKFVTEKE